MNLSRHFTLAEFCRSEVAIRRGIDNTPNEMQLERLRWLCTHILEPLRVALGKPIRINSGYRNLAVNKLVGGATASAHLEGRAADIECDWPNLTLAQFIKRKNFSELDKCLLEYPRADDAHAGWVHVQVPRKGDTGRLQFITAKSVNGKTEYSVGLKL